jgi:hypothetical protein
MVGEGGRGKSVLCPHLARQLLARRAPGEPVPVVLALSGWDPRTVGLDDWIVERLGIDVAPRPARRGGAPPSGLASQAHAQLSGSTRRAASDGQIVAVLARAPSRSRIASSQLVVGAAPPARRVRLLVHEPTVARADRARTGDEVGDVTGSRRPPLPDATAGEPPTVHGVAPRPALAHPARQVRLLPDLCASTSGVQQSPGASPPRRTPSSVSHPEPDSHTLPGRCDGFTACATARAGV